MKQTIIALLFCAALVAVNANFIEDIISKTHLKGKVNVNTSKGLDVDYKGGLQYDSDYIKMDLINFGAKFNAVPQESTNVSDGNKTAGSVTYSGGFDVAYGNHTAHVAASGAAGYQGEVDVEKDNKTGATLVTYKKGLINNNTWNATTDNLFLSGNHTGGLEAAGHLGYLNNKIRHLGLIRGFAATNGKAVLNNGTEVGTFAAGKAGGVAYDKAIKVNPNATGKQPNFVYRGKAVFGKKAGAQWNNDTWVDGKKGQAAFAGVGWAQKKADENVTGFGVGALENVNYLVHEVWGHNGKKDGDIGIKGHAQVAKGFRAGHFANGTNAGGVIHGGRFNQWAKGNVKNSHETDAIDSEIIGKNDINSNLENLGINYEPITEKSLEEDYDESLFDKNRTRHHRHHHKNNYKGHLHGKWKSGGFVTADPVDGKNATVVNVHTGAIWDIAGEDNEHGEFEWEGNKTGQGSWIVVNTNDTDSPRIENIKGKIGRDDEFVDSLTKRFQRLVDRLMN